MSDRKDWNQKGKSLRNLSQALMIPSLFLGSPLGIGFLGYLIGNYFGAPRTGIFIGLVIGFVIAIKETVRFARNSSK